MNGSTESRAGTGLHASATEAWLVFRLFLSLFVLTSAGFDTSEGVNHYMVARQIVTQGALGFSQPQEGIFTVAPNGRTYASHEIGNTLFLLPVAAFNTALEHALAPRLGDATIGYITGFVVALVAAFYCALTIALLYTLLRVFFRIPLHAALGGSFAFALCTYIWAYTRCLFDGVLCMTLLAGAMLLLFQFSRTRSTRGFLAMTVLLGLGVITRLSMLICLVAFGVYLATILWSDRRRLVRLLFLGAVVLLPFAVWQLYYNQLRTGSWLLSPVQTEQYAANNALTADLLVSVPGLLFSPGKSLFLFFPLALVSLFCFRRFRTAYPPEAVFTATLAALWFLLHAKIAAWSTLWAWGPKYFVTVAPILALPACVEWEWLKGTRLRRGLLWCSLVPGALISAASIIGNYHSRIALAYLEGRQRRLVWSAGDGQAFDMVASAAGNLRRLILHLPSAPPIPGLSPANTYASNTVNIWFNSAAHQGVPILLLVLTALVLLWVGVHSFSALRRLGGATQSAVRA